MRTQNRSFPKSVFLLVFFGQMHFGQNSARGQEGVDESKNRVALLRTVAVSRDGKLAFAGDGGGTILVWDLTRQKLTRRISYPAPNANTVPCYAFSGDGKLAIMGRRIGEPLTLWDLTNGSKNRVFDVTDPVISVALSSESNRALSVTIHRLPIENTHRPPQFPREIQLWDALTGKLIRKLADGCRTGFLPVAFSTDGKLAVAGNGGFTGKFGKIAGWDLKVWDAERGMDVLTVPAREEDNVTCLAFAADDEHLVAGYHRNVRVWKLGAVAPLWTHRNLSQRWLTRSVAFAPNGRFIIAAGPDTDYLVGLPKNAFGGMVLLDASSGEQIHKFGGIHDWMRTTVFTPDSQQVLGATGGALKSWNVANGEVRLTLIP